MFLNYIKIMKNIITETDEKDRENYFLNILRIISNFLIMIIIHAIVIFFFEFENFFIVVLLINESVVILGKFLKMKERKENKLDYTDSDEKSESDSDSDNEREELLYKRGKKCLRRWMIFIIYHYLFPIISSYILLFIENKELYSIAKYTLVIPKILVALWLTR